MFVAVNTEHVLIQYICTLYGNRQLLSILLLAYFLCWPNTAIFIDTSKTVPHGILSISGQSKTNTNSYTCYILLIHWTYSISMRTHTHIQHKQQHNIDSIRTSSFPKWYFVCNFQRPYFDTLHNINFEELFILRTGVATLEYPKILYKIIH